jgi:glycosyltransferase involved in cell wall biosynthesis
MNAPLVSVCCFAYNHAHFIRKCLDGFIMQKTNFPFEVIIHDDASSDGTADSIREYEARYPEIIKPIYQTENQYSQGKIFFIETMFPRLTGKYIAYCEGDDYWTYPYKLQEQFDFLETHPDYSMCSSGCLIDKDGELTEDIVKCDEAEGFEYTEFGRIFCYRILTMLTRKDAYAELLKKCKEYQKHNRSISDSVIVYHLLRSGKGWYFPKVYGVYRMHSGGVWSTLSWEQQTCDNYFLIKDLYYINHDKSIRWLWQHFIETRVHSKLYKTNGEKIKLLFEYCRYTSVRKQIVEFVNFVKTQTKVLIMKILKRILGKKITAKLRALKKRRAV